MTAGRTVIVGVLAAIAFAATYFLLPSSAESGATKAPSVLPMPAPAIKVPPAANADPLPSLARRPRKPPRRSAPRRGPSGPSAAPPPAAAPPAAAPPAAAPPAAPQPPPVIQG